MNQAYSSHACRTGAHGSCKGAHDAALGGTCACLCHSPGGLPVAHAERALQAMNNDLGALLETKQAQLDAATEEIARLTEAVNETVEAKRNIGNLLAMAANEASAFGPGPVHERIFRMREHYEKLLKEARS